MLLIAVVML